MTEIVWADEGDGEFGAYVERHSDGVEIRATLMAPGSEFNDGPGWAYSMYWDTGEDPDIAYECHLSGEVESRADAEAAVLAGVSAALIQGNEDTEAKAAIVAALEGDGITHGGFR